MCCKEQFLCGDAAHWRGTQANGARAAEVLTGFAADENKQCLFWWCPVN